MKADMSRSSESNCKLLIRGTATVLPIAEEFSDEETRMIGKYSFVSSKMSRLESTVNTALSNARTN